MQYIYIFVNTCNIFNNISTILQSIQQSSYNQYGTIIEEERKINNK